METDFNILLPLLFLTFFGWVVLWVFLSVISHLIVVAIRAKQKANASKPFRPPNQLRVNKNNEWEAVPGSQRLAWWRTFLEHIK